jgi:predicted ester cyclase
MGVREQAEDLQQAINTGDLDTVATYLADDFQFSGPIPEPVGAQEWLGLLRVLRGAFPDLQFNFRILSVEGNVVRAANQLTGMHTGELDLSFMGLGVIPPTGKSFSNPVEEVEGVWDGDQLVSTHVHSQEGGGLMGILTQLGVGPAPS